jgi:hypothetical protein
MRLQPSCGGYERWAGTTLMAAKNAIDLISPEAESVSGARHAIGTGQRWSLVPQLRIDRDVRPAPVSDLLQPTKPLTRR